MKSRRISTKIISFLLVCIMLAGAAMPTVYAQMDETLLYTGYRITSQENYKLVSGITETHYVINNETNTNQIRAYAIDINLSNPDISIVAGYNDGDFDEWGRATVLNQAAALEKKRDLNIIGGINGDFFNKDNGCPQGILVMDGQLGHPASGFPYFAILKDGRAVIRDSWVSTADVKEAIGGAVILVRNGKVIASDTGYLAPRTAVGIKANGDVVFYVCDGRQQPDSCGMDNREVAHAMLSLGCVIALGLDGGGSSTFVTTREASKSLSTQNKPCYIVDRPVSTSLFVCSSAQPTGIFDHVTFEKSRIKCKTASSVIVKYSGVDENGYSAKLPSGGKLVVEDSDYGYTVGNSFYAKGKKGDVKVNYVCNDVIYGSTVINVDPGNPDIFTILAADTITWIRNLITIMKFALEKIFQGEKY